MPRKSSLRTVLWLCLWRCAAITAVQADQGRSAQDLATRINAHLAAAWSETGVQVAPPATDAEFLRRAYLDIAGRIPTVAEARSFLADGVPNKRDRLIGDLVESPATARHFATVWRRIWLPQFETPQFGEARDDFEEWLFGRLCQDASYDGIIFDLLTAPMHGEMGRVDGSAIQAAPASFLEANEFKPENLAANTTRAFLGINLECAQCHDHPFARWSREAFWQTSAFFARPTLAGGGASARLELTIAGTDRVVNPRLLTGKGIELPEQLGPDTGRRLLASWVVAKNNPYFARNAVNRVWAHFLGVGLVEPVDDLSADNVPSHPGLLDELAEAFVDSDFDWKYLIAATASSEAYQLSSIAPSPSPTVPSPTGQRRLFARMPVRGLSGEQLYDSLLTAAGFPQESQAPDPSSGARRRDRFGVQFRVDRPVTAQRSIAQALSIRNGPVTVAATTLPQSPMLRSVAEAPFLTTSDKLESLYLATLGRFPTSEERARLVRLVDGADDGVESRRALEDLFWVLLNSTEFNTNH